MDYQYRFTVFTPAYNRAGLLPRLYESLKAQSYRDFEWLIIDDGSTDSTGELVEGWSREGLFPIRYVWQGNAGKHVAFNRAAQMASGELLLEIDSDDALLPDALQLLANHWAAIQALPPAEAASFSGVTGLCQDQFGHLIGDRFPQDVFDSDSNEILYRYKIRGEKFGFHRTEVFKEFPFPVLANHAFVPLSIVWNTIGRKYKTRFVNDLLRVYWLHDEGRISTTGFVPASSPGHALWHRDVLNTNLKYFKCSPADFVKSSVHYTRFSLHSGDSFRAQARQLKGPGARALWLGAAPLGWLVYQRDRRAVSSRH